MPNVLGEIHYYFLFRHYILVNPICPDTFEHIQKPEWGKGVNRVIILFYVTLNSDHITFLQNEKQEICQE